MSPREFMQAVSVHPDAKPLRNVDVLAVMLYGAICELKVADKCTVRLVSIQQAVARNEGRSSRAMKRLCELADRHGVTIVATVEPFGGTTGEGELSRAELHSWYHRAGFAKVQADDYSESPV
jgi:hypothetical protein